MRTPPRPGAMAAIVIEILRKAGCVESRESEAPVGIDGPDVGIGLASRRGYVRLERSDRRVFGEVQQLTGVGSHRFTLADASTVPQCE